MKTRAGIFPKVISRILANLSFGSSLFRCAILLTASLPIPLCLAHADSNPLPAAATIASQSAYQEVSRGPHSRIMQRAITLTNAAGNVVIRTNRYTELATGMSVLRNGQYVPASDHIHITAGGATCTNCQHQVNFAANLNSPGAVDLVTLKATT